MTKSKWKCEVMNNKLFQLKSNILKKKNIKKEIYLKNKNFYILDLFLNNIFKIYNGFSFVEINIKPYMIGQKFGCYLFTKRAVKHKVYKRSHRKKRK